MQKSFRGTSLIVPAGRTIHIVHVVINPVSNGETNTVSFVRGGQTINIALNSCNTATNYLIDYGQGKCDVWLFPGEVLTCTKETSVIYEEFDA